MAASSVFETPPPSSEACGRCSSDPCICTTFIGGSDAHSLLNVRLFGRGCARQLGYKKSGVLEDFPEETHRRKLTLRGLFQRGHLLEDIAAKMYMQATGRSLIRRARLVRHPEVGKAAVHTDRLVLADNGKPTGDAEIKSMNEGVFLGMLRNGLPAGYSLQLQYSLFVTGHTWGSAVIIGVFGELPLKHFDVTRDEQLMEIFAREVNAFWDVLAKGELPPQLPDPHDSRCKVCPWRLTCRGELIDPDELARLMAEKKGKQPLTPIQNDELDQALYDRALILSEMAALSSEDEEEPGALQLITTRVKELVGDTEHSLVNKHWRVHCTDNKWSGLDVQRFRLEQPEIYKRYFISQRPTGKKRLTVSELTEKEQ